MVEDAISDLAASEGVTLTVVGWSMEPLLFDGDRVVLRSRRRYLPGDLVCFRHPRSRDLVTHRLVGGFWRDGEWRLLTRSERTGRFDPPVPVTDVFGRVTAIGDRAFHPRLVQRIGCLLAFGREVARRAFGAGE
jgi:hypothetical protein